MTSKPSRTNCPKAFYGEEVSVLSGVDSFSRVLTTQVSCVQMSTIHDVSIRGTCEKEETSGGYCGGVPPLSIPNREVKPTYADGTAMQCGRVGSRLLFKSKSSLEDSNIFGAFLFLFFLSLSVLLLYSHL